MSTTTPTTPRRASPLRVLQRLSWRFKSAKAPGLATQVMDEQLATHEADIVTAGAEARQIEGGLEATRREMSAALTDPVSPGIITESEARQIAAGMIGTAVLAHAHTERLGAML